MTHPRITWIVLPAIVLGAGAWAVSRSITTPAPDRPAQAKWAYARLYIGDGKAVFFEAGKQSTVSPPLNRLSGNVTRGEPAGEGYTVAAKMVRDHDVAALNLVGSQGWEAVSVTPKGKGLLVLLKRSY